MGLPLNVVKCPKFILGRFEYSHGLRTALKGSSPDFQGQQQKSTDFHFDWLVFFFFGFFLRYSEIHFPLHSFGGQKIHLKYIIVSTLSLQRDSNIKCRALFSWGNTANHWANMLAYDKIPAKLIILPSNSTALCSSIHSWRLNTLKSDGAHVTVNSSKCLHYITILQTHYYGSSCSLILQLFDSLLVEWQQKGPFQWSAPGQSSNAH